MGTWKDAGHFYTFVIVFFCPKCAVLTVILIQCTVNDDSRHTTRQILQSVTVRGARQWPVCRPPPHF